MTKLLRLQYTSPQHLIEYEAASYLSIVHQVLMPTLMLQAYVCILQRPLMSECSYLELTPKQPYDTDFSFTLSSYSLKVPDTGTLLCKGTHDCQL